MLLSLFVPPSFLAMMWCISVFSIPCSDCPHTTHKCFLREIIKLSTLLLCCFGFLIHPLPRILYVNFQIIFILYMTLPLSGELRGLPCSVFHTVTINLDPFLYSEEYSSLQVDYILQSTSIPVVLCYYEASSKGSLSLTILIVFSLQPRVLDSLYHIKSRRLLVYIVPVAPHIRLLTCMYWQS